MEVNLNLKNPVKDVKKDCFAAMAPVWIINTLQETITGVLMVWLASLVAEFTDAILQFDSETLVSGIGKVILCVVILVFILPLTSYFCNIIMLKQALKHDRKVISRFLLKKHNEAMKMGVGEAQSRLENDPNDYRICWMEIMTQVASLPIVIFYLIYSSLNADWQYALIMMAISIARIFLPIAIRKLNAKYDKETREYTTELRSRETDITSQPHNIVMLGINKGILKRIESLFWDYYQHTGQKRAIYDSITTFLLSIIEVLSWISIVVVGAVFVSQSRISAGVVAAMLGFSSLYDSAINSIICIIKEKSIIKTLSERMLVLYENAESSEASSTNELKEINTITLNKLSYKYNDTYVFAPLSFTIKNGDKIAVCGENGSGKSTLLNILCRLNYDYDGSVKINNMELSSISSKYLRRQLSLATQDPFLFPGTVLDNLTFGGLASTEEAMSVLEDMGIGYLANRDVSVNQDSLSVGEKQRISLSRVILKKAPIILLDEPDNHLDSESVSVLKEYISSSNNTIIYVSHTDSLTALASKILVINKNVQKEM